MNEVERAATVACILALASDLTDLDKEKREQFAWLAKHIAEYYNVDFEEMIKMVNELIKEAYHVNEQIMLEALR